jgi:hypothetical protein
VRTIADAYFGLGIVDDHFLYVRGLPFFGRTWTYLVAFAVMRKDFCATDAYIARAVQKLTDYDFPPLQRFYECVKSDDYVPAVRELEGQLAKWDSRFSAGFQNVQLAALRARGAKVCEDAISALQEVHLAPNDFPWLGDVLTIHKAWAFARAGEAERETAETDRFLAKHRALFEPDHCVSFAFLPYQEKLKVRYQNGTIDPGNAPSG